MDDQTSKAEERRPRSRKRGGSPGAKESAAITIQKHYRGYRARRQLNGLGLDASTRWTEALKEVHYRNTMRPLSEDRESSAQDSHRKALNNWHLITEAARRAASDDTSDTGGEEGMSLEELQEYKARKQAARRKMATYAKVMDLPYWLEMVDQKHRYGANLRAYHNEWQRSDTKENFFYWLDHGEGKMIEVPTISRERLENMQVRYLSREERQQYLVRVDSEGRLCWAKNGKRISTTTEFRDSVQGVVPVQDETPTWSSPFESMPHGPRHQHRRTWSSGSSSSSHASDDSEEGEEGEPYATPQFSRAKGLKKLKQVSPAIVLNKLLLKTVRPNTWIFVADTSFRLYVGIKQSGTFQHSSFLQGARISSAGLIKIQDGQLRKLSPLSGHYRTPTKNFRLFMKSLKIAGVDTSKLSISRSYAVLVGLEAYGRSRKAIRNGISHMLHPVQHKREEEAKRKSLSSWNGQKPNAMDSDQPMVLPDRTKHVVEADKISKALPKPTDSHAPDASPAQQTTDTDQTLVPTISEEMLSTGILVDKRTGKPLDPVTI